MSKQQVLVLGEADAIAHAVVAALTASEWATPLLRDGKSLLNVTEFGSAELADACNEADAIVAAFSGSAQAILNQAAALFGASSPWRHKKIIHVSSMTVYGAVTGTVDEDTATGTALNDYAAARVAAERLAAAYPQVITLRVGVEYGPGCKAWSERVANWLLARRIGDLGALGDGYCNLIYIDDVANAVIKALQLPSEANRIFNLAAPEPSTWNEYFLRYGKALGAVPVNRISRRRVTIEVKLLAPLLKIAEKCDGLFGTQGFSSLPAIPPSALTTFAQEIKLESKFAASLLKPEWTPLDEGLKQTAHWFKTR